MQVNLSEDTGFEAYAFKLKILEGRYAKPQRVYMQEHYWTHTL